MQNLLRYDLVHRAAVALTAGKIGQLPHQVDKALARKRWDGTRCIAMRLRSVTLRAILCVNRGATLGMRIQRQGRLRRLID